MPNPPPCWHYDPSVEGRYKLFKASMEELLNPDQRIPKITLVNEPIIIDGPNFTGDERGFRLQVPAGIPSAIVGNLRHKEFVADLVLVKTNIPALKEKYQSQGAKVDEIVATLQKILQQLTIGLAKDPESAIAQIGEEHLAFIQQMYSNSMVDVENDGHTYGQGLSAQDKKALIAFLATL